MLLTLRLRDFVIVDQLELNFHAGFTVLTGETGAGKSILIDALGLLLGDRADAGVVRNGADKAELAGEFETPPPLELWLAEHALGGDPGVCLLRRVIDASGRSRAFVNGQSVTLAQLKEVGEMLVDIHGQHAHQLLLRSDAQRQLLDAYAGASEQAAAVRSAWRDWQQARERYETASRDAEQHQSERERLEWQIQEIDKLQLTAAEWSDLQAEHGRLSHAVSLQEGGELALTLLAEGEPSCQSLLAQLLRKLGELSQYDGALQETLDLLTGAEAQVSEAVYALRHYVQKVELDPGRLAEVEQRIDDVMRQARKYRCEPEALPERLAAWKQRLQQLGGSEGLAGLQAEAEAAGRQFQQRAALLTQRRQGAACELALAVTEQLQALAMGGSRFAIALLPGSPGPHGLEQLEFQVAQHEATTPKSLAKVASGGELSRISLALQVVTSQLSAVPTLIFDEVDVGIGGGVAEIVGKLLKQLGQRFQVLCITHLPQVAACGDWQLQVAKSRSEAGVLSRISELDTAARIEEIARMLGGVDITDTTRAHASELLGWPV